MRYALPLVLLLLVSPACTKETATEPAPAEETAPDTVRDRAEKVGAVGDATMTDTLQHDLTGIVDANEQRAKELEEANR